MSDIFLSYTRDDLERVRPLAAALEAKGWTVFWDLTIPAGETWRRVIGSQLEAARCVVVAWSNASIHRQWVLDEADSGFERGVLVPLKLDAVAPPLGFRSIQAADFRDWQGDADAAAFRQLVEAVAKKIGQPPSAVMPPVNSANQPEKPPAKPEPKPEPPRPFSILRHTLRDGSPGPEMVLIPAGEFRMGDLDGSGRDDEKPAHRVRIAQPFYIGRYAVTFDDYDLFAQAQGIELPNDRGWGRGRRPVINVSWDDAVAYCRWLSEQTGSAYRLPSEAEWEYAARAGTESAYWWGDKIGSNRANCRDSGSEWSGKKTAPVGSFPANPWGLHDTVGNVWEWVQDCWHENYQGAPEDGSVWEACYSTYRVLRGGSWYFDPSLAHTVYRYCPGPGSHDGSIGFRLAFCLAHP